MLLLTCLCASLGVRPVDAAAPTENQLKAAFLYNFAQFVQWPTSAFTDPDAPLRICVLGRDPFGNDLDHLVSDEAANGRRIVVARPRDIRSTRCHILFISASESARFADILADLQGQSVLTVGDSKDFVGRGGVIGFVTMERRIRLRINSEAALANHLSISSRLLRLADVVPRGDSDRVAR